MVESDRSQSELARIGLHFADLARLLSTDERPPDPARLVSFATRAIPNCTHGAMTLIGANGKPSTHGATDDLPVQVDALQFSLREGPCLEAAEEDDLVRVDELAEDARWPAFGPACVEQLGIHSMFCIRLRLPGKDRAALNFYAQAPHSFDDLGAGVAAIFAPFAALAVQNLLAEKRMGNLETALQSSRQIGTAMGILMARGLLTSEQAFDKLATASQHLNRKLRDIAAEVQLTGELPSLPGAADRAG